MGRPSKLTDLVIQRIEGRTSEIRVVGRQPPPEQSSDAAKDYTNAAAKGRPVIDAYAWVAEVADCGRATVERWVTAGRHALAREGKGRKLTADERTLARFVDAFDTLRTSSAQRVADPLLDTAMQSTDRTNQIAAAKLVLPRIDPQGWGPQAVRLDVEVKPQESLTIEQLPQEVIDRLSDSPELLEAIAAHEQAIAEARQAIDEIIASLS